MIHYWLIGLFVIKNITTIDLHWSEIKSSSDSGAPVTGHLLWSTRYFKMSFFSYTWPVNFDTTGSWGTSPLTIYKNNKTKRQLFMHIMGFRLSMKTYLSKTWPRTIEYNYNVDLWCYRNITSWRATRKLFFARKVRAC